MSTCIFYMLTIVVGSFLAISRPPCHSCMHVTVTVEKTGRMFSYFAFGCIYLGPEPGILDWYSQCVEG